MGRPDSHPQQIDPMAKLRQVAQRQSEFARLSPEEQYRANLIERSSITVGLLRHGICRTRRDAADRAILIQSDIAVSRIRDELKIIDQAFDQDELAATAILIEYGLLADPADEHVSTFSPKPLSSIFRSVE